MKSVLITIGILFALSATAQDIVVLKHTNYISHYSKSKKYPVMVECGKQKQKLLVLLH
jgi:hypothetical protein